MLTPGRGNLHDLANKRLERVLVDQAGDRPRKPIWRFALHGVGWLFTALGTLLSVSNAIAGFAGNRPAAIVLAGLLAAGSASVLLGRILIVAAAVGESQRRVHRLQLWARLLRIAGLLLCISWPCLLLYEALQHFHLMGKFGAGDFFFRLAMPTYIEQALPAMVIGLIAIGCAEIWGRHKRPVYVSDVFT